VTAPSDRLLAAGLAAGPVFVGASARGLGAVAAGAAMLAAFIGTSAGFTGVAALAPVAGLLQRRSPDGSSPSAAPVVSW
jgi:hypothetical protein